MNDGQFSDPRIGHNYDTLELALDKQGNPAKDGTYKNSKGEPGPRLLYTKKLDGTYYVVEAIQDNAYKQLQVVSAYLSPDAKKGAQSQNSGTPGAQAPNASPNEGPYTLGFTSETGLPSPSDDNISQNGNESNNNVDDDNNPPPSSGAGGGSANGADVEIRERGESRNIRTDDARAEELRNFKEQNPDI